MEQFSDLQNAYLFKLIVKGLFARAEKSHLFIFLVFYSVFLIIIL